MNTYITNRRNQLNNEFVRATQQEEQAAQVLENAKKVKENISIAQNELNALEQTLLSDPPKTGTEDVASGDVDKSIPFNHDNVRQKE